ncbi:HNH endonuclease family protein [Campylobacter lari]
MIEKFIFLIFEISKRRSNTGDSTFYNYANQYYHNDKSNISIKDIIGVYDLKNDEYSGINWWLVSYVDIEQFYIYLKDKFKNKDGYYSWTGLSYFLFEYELSLQHKSKNNTIKINWKEYINSKKDYNSIEHILPQTPTDEYWVNKLKQVNSDDYKYIINSLGNLIPLSKAKNSKLNNKNFYIKKNGEDGEFIGYKNGSYSEQEINEKEEWGIKEINERTNKLIEFLINHWEIDKYCLINNTNNKLNFIKTIK